MPNQFIKVALRTSLLYVAVAGSWILFSDVLLHRLVSDPDIAVHLEIYKGLAFVVVTALLLYWELRRQLRRLEQEAVARQQTEKKLRESEVRFSKIFHSSPLGIVISRPNDGRILDANDAFAKIFGFTREEMVGRTSRELNLWVHSDEEREKMLKALPMHGQCVNLETKLRRKNGETGDLFRSVELIELAGEPLLLSMTRDITEQKQAETAWHQTNARIHHLNNVLRAIQDVHNLLNREKNSRNLLAGICDSLVQTRGYVTVWVGQPEAESKRVLPVAQAGANTAFLQHAQITWDDSPFGQGPAGTAIRERRAVVFDDIGRDPRFAPWRDEVVDSGGSSIASIPIIHGERLFGALTIKADRPQAFDAEEVVLLTGLAADVARALHHLEEEAARRKAEEQLRKLSRAVEHSPASIIITDPAGNIEYINPKFTELTGYTMDEVRGKNSQFLKSGETPNSVYQHLWQTITAGREWRGEFHNRKKNGELYWESASISPIFDDAGNITHFLAVKEDITSHRNLEAQLRQVQKMEAIGQLAGGVAHDFNNILTVIQGNADLLQNPDLEPLDIRDCGTQIAHAAGRAAGLTRQLLMFARKQQMQPASLNLNESVAQMTRMLQRILGEDIELHSEYAPGLPLIRADAGMIEQIILNLAVNARDAMANGGKLTLRTTVKKMKRQDGPENAPAEPHVCLSVTDTGGGIAPEILPRIFEPFFTTKEAGKGTGLGLATVYGIVQQHRGQIITQSEPGKGTTFEVGFPAFTETELARTQPPKTAALPRSTGTILLVEDDPSLCIFVRNLLQRHGFIVLEARSGPAALKLWQAARDRIQFVFTDIVLPGEMNGFDLGQRLLADKPSLKIIYTSGYTGDLEGRLPALVEGVSFIRKPFKPEDLAEIIRKNLDGENSRR